MRARGIAADNIRKCNRAASPPRRMQQRNARLAPRNIVNSKCCSDPKAPCSPTCAAALKAYEDNPYPPPLSQECACVHGCTCECMCVRVCVSTCVLRVRMCAIVHAFLSVGCAAHAHALRAGAAELSPCAGARARLRACVGARALVRARETMPGHRLRVPSQVRAVADGQAAEHGAQEKGVFASPGRSLEARHRRVLLSMLSAL